MTEIKISVELEEELETSDRFGIEDAVADALRQLGYTVEQVRLYFS